MSWVRAGNRCDEGGDSHAKQRDGVPQLVQRSSPDGSGSED